MIGVWYIGWRRVLKLFWVLRKIEIAFCDICYGLRGRVLILRSDSLRMF